ncbi:MAG: mechanosensitive ion channel family protein [Candidatus Thermoplasmatota archaeon]|nr:mechanosensitive ion channel family protein [Candidatus Thermoplasmatota archaeon]
MEGFWKKVLIAALFVMITFFLAVVDMRFDVKYLSKVFLTLVSITLLYLVLKLLVEEFLVGRLRDYRTRYTVKKTTSILFLLLASVFIIGIWIENTQAILVAYGLIAAGIAISLQDLFKGFTGGILILVSNLYRVGDRIEIGGTYGDVMDIGILYTTLMETRGWVLGDQASGRIISLPNSNVLTNAVKNYTKDHSFLWEEITIPVTFDSNWEPLIEPILLAVREYTSDLTKQASKEIIEIGEKYYLPRRDVEPAVYVTFDQSFIKISVRYVTEAKMRRFHADALHRLILKEAAKHKDVKIAQSQLESWKYGEGPT